MTVLIVIPTLNEASHIAQVIACFLPFAQQTGARIVVADGGSTDGTTAIVHQLATVTPQLLLMDNPGRLQSAGINLAVVLHGEGCDWLLRADAHSHYPADFCRILLDEAALTGADSVVVAMHAVATQPLQGLIAVAQNSRLGNGGSAHRNQTDGRWVDHGHHALMQMQAFRAVGGYDPTFSHNEDAELDHRLRAAGYRLWLTARTGLDYFPRQTVSALIRQYYRFGKGRARNLLKHRLRPAPRQAVVAAVAPLLGLAVLTPLSGVFALPMIVWAGACLAGGIAIAVAQQRPGAVVSGFLAGAMHVAWSFGFWVQTLTKPRDAQVRQ